METCAMVEELHPQQPLEHSPQVRSERIRPVHVHCHAQKHQGQEASRPNVLESGVGGDGGGIGDAAARLAAEHDAHDRQPSHWIGNHCTRDLQVAVAVENRGTFACHQDGDAADRA